MGVAQQKASDNANQLYFEAITFSHRKGLSWSIEQTPNHLCDKMSCHP